MTDRAGSITLGPDGAITARHDHAERWGDRSPPRMFTAVGDGRFLGVGASSLSTSGRDGLARVRVSTGPARRAQRRHRPRRNRLDHRRFERLARPARRPNSRAHRAPARRRAHPHDRARRQRRDGQRRRSGGPLARDGGARWHRFDPPTQLGAPIAMTLDPHGALLVAMPGALMVCEGDRVSVVETPQRDARTTQRPLLTVFGDRWVYIDGEVFTSDDQGPLDLARPQRPRGRGPRGRRRGRSARPDPRARTRPRPCGAAPTRAGDSPAGPRTRFTTAPPSSTRTEAASARPRPPGRSPSPGTAPTRPGS